MSGPHDFTVRDEALSSKRAPRVHRIPLPTSVTIASRPSLRERDGDRYASDLGFLKIRKFLRKGLDMPFSDLPVRQRSQGELSPLRNHRRQDEGG